MSYAKTIIRGIISPVIFAGMSIHAFHDDRPWVGLFAAVIFILFTVFYVIQILKYKRKTK